MTTYIINIKMLEKTMSIINPSSRHWFLTFSTRSQRHSPARKYKNLFWSTVHWTNVKDRERLDICQTSSSLSDGTLSSGAHLAEGPEVENRLQTSFSSQILCVALLDSRSDGSAYVVHGTCNGRSRQLFSSFFCLLMPEIAQTWTTTCNRRSPVTDVSDDYF